jgi:serine/threonine protein kinase
VTKSVSGESDREQRVNDVLLAYVEEAQAGGAPDRGRLLAAYPDLRPELEEFFACHDEVERLAAPWRRAEEESPRVEAPGPGPGDGAPEVGRIGDFRLLREVGRGGMGVVYEAEQLSLRRRVALKVLSFAAAIDSRQLQRFHNEALAAGHLRHENIVPVYAVGSERGVHYYAMPFIEGRSLAALIAELRRRADGAAQPGAGPPGSAAETPGLFQAVTGTESGPADADRPGGASRRRERSSGKRWYFDWVAGLGRQAAVALDYAHHMGIVHRDVKPANLLLDPRGQLWVTDFGLAHYGGDTGLTVTGEILGTLRYASPEQALVRPGVVDHRSDVYSLGATLYELLTLRPIFDGRDRHELLRQIADEEPRPPRSLDRAIPVELETILLKATAKDPGERYVTAQELADDLQRFRDDRPVRARRPTLLEKATKWARRHRPVVASAVAALLLTVGGLAVATVLTARAYDRERQKAREADQQRAYAEENFREARRAVDQLARIGEEELAGNRDLERLRGRLLEAALTYYQDFIEQHRDDPAIQRELESSRARVETILGELTALMRAARYIPLHQKDVQDELRLTEGQRQAIARLAERWHEEFSASFRQGPEEGDRRRLALARYQEEEVERVLTPAQLRRFQQLALQYLGGNALSDPELGKTLLLTAEQKQRIGRIQEEARRTKSGSAGPGGRSGREGRKPDEDGSATRTQLLDVLTVEQKARWDEMLGPPFPGSLGPGARGRPPGRPNDGPPGPP